MFQMTCSNCGGRITSEQLSEVQLFLCPRCDEVVVVEDVVISTPNKFTSLRTSMKNVLFSARDKFQRNKAERPTLQENYDFNKRLSKLLRRDDFRLNLSHDFFVQINFGDHNQPVKLLNISSTGAAIEFFETDCLPDNDADVSFRLLLPGQTEPLFLASRVVWIGTDDKASSTVTMGLRFNEVDEAMRSSLWDYIVHAETSTQA